MSYKPSGTGKIAFSAYNSAIQANHSNITKIAFDTLDNVNVVSSTSVELPAYSFAWADVRQNYYSKTTGNANLSWDNGFFEKTKGTEQTGDTQSGTKDMGPAIAYALNNTDTVRGSEITNTNANPSIDFDENGLYNRVIGFKL
jgi:hypothetical protein